MAASGRATLTEASQHLPPLPGHLVVEADLGGLLLKVPARPLGLYLAEEAVLRLYATGTPLGALTFLLGQLGGSWLAAHGWPEALVLAATALAWLGMGLLVLGFLTVLLIPVFAVLERECTLHWTPRALVIQERVGPVRLPRRTLPLDAVQSAHARGGRVEVEGPGRRVFVRYLDVEVAQWLASALSLRGEGAEGPPEALFALVQSAAAAHLAEGGEQTGHPPRGS